MEWWEIVVTIVIVILVFFILAYAGAWIVSGSFGREKMVGSCGRN